MAEAVLRPQRFEAKYRISELQAQAIRDYILPYVAVDAHVLQGAEYPVNSLYFDTPSLRLYRESVQGFKNRFKLRIRNYSNRSEDVAFFEIKRRIDQVVSKRRGLADNVCAEDFLSGENGQAAPEHFRNGLDVVSEFRDLVDRLGAVPTVHVRYQREAYVSRMEDGVRITFDREVECARYDPDRPLVWPDSADWRSLDLPDVILEVKFTGGYPYWVQGLVRRFNLIRCSMAKYVAGVDQLRREGLHASTGRRRIA